MKKIILFCLLLLLANCVTKSDIFIDLSPRITHFGNVSMCTEASRTVMLVSTSSSTDTFKGTLGTGIAGDFKLVCNPVNCSLKVSPNSQVLIATIYFKPTSTTTGGTSFGITNHTPCWYNSVFYNTNDPIFLNADGTGIAPNLSLNYSSVSPLNFGNVTVCTTLPNTMTISKSSSLKCDVEVTVFGEDLIAPFSLTEGHFDFTLNDQLISQTIHLSFTPQAGSSFNQQFRISYNAYGYGNKTDNYVLQGTGIPVPAPTLMFPTDSSTNISNTPQLDWSDITAADLYWVQVSTDQNFGTLVIDNNSIPSSLFQITEALQSGTVYYWRAAARYCNTWTAFMTPFSFTTVLNLPPSVPQLLSPVYAASEVSVTPLLQWGAVGGATLYRVQVSAYSNFAVIWYEGTTASTQMQVPPGHLAYNSGYYWRVKAKSAVDSSSYQSPFVFYTMVTPPLQLLSPPHGAVDVPLTPTLDWTDVTGAEKYWVQLSADASFSTTLIDDSLNITTSQYIVPSGKLTGNVYYYWKAATRKNGVWSALSDTSGFRTAGGVTPPELVSPSYGGTGVVVTPVMDWSDIEGAVAYRLQISAFSNFAVLWVNQYVNGASTYQVLPGYLAYNSRYYWRVKSFGAADSSGYSQIYNFFTKINPGALSKARNTVHLDFANLLSGKFSAVTLEICRDTLFTNFEIVIVNVTSQEIDIPTADLASYGTYFWRLKQVDKNGKASYSITQVFVTDYTGENEPECFNAVIPVKYELYQNYPNPFNPTTSLRFDLPKASLSKITIYDILGRKAVLLFDGRLEAGSYIYEWDASAFASGVYLCKLETGDYVKTMKMVLMK